MVSSPLNGGGGIFFFKGIFKGGPIFYGALKGGQMSVGGLRNFLLRGGINIYFFIKDITFSGSFICLFITM